MASIFSREEARAILDEAFSKGSAEVMLFLSEPRGRAALFSFVHYIQNDLWDLVKNKGTLRTDDLPDHLRDLAPSWYYPDAFNEASRIIGARDCLPIGSPDGAPHQWQRPGVRIQWMTSPLMRSLVLERAKRESSRFERVQEERRPSAGTEAAQDSRSIAAQARLDDYESKKKAVEDYKRAHNLPSLKEAVERMVRDKILTTKKTPEDYVRHLAAGIRNAKKTLRTEGEEAKSKGE